MRGVFTTFGRVRSGVLLLDWEMLESWQIFCKIATMVGKIAKIILVDKFTILANPLPPIEAHQGTSLITVYAVDV